MGYVDFLQALLDEGRVAVSPPGPISESEVELADSELIAFEKRYRLEVPAEPPRLHLPAARWAGTNFYQACRFVVHRDADEAALEIGLQSNYDAAATAAVHYSVDVIFRFLPDLLRMAKQLAPDDPLVARLKHWARCWPLSSVGIDDVGAVAVDAFAGCPSLLLLYVDRIFATGDASRLQDHRVAEAARGAVGAYSELAGRLAPLLAVTRQHFSREST
jgi:hypothetical protein